MTSYEFVTIALLGLVASLWLADKCAGAWLRFREWETVQKERERRHALRVATGHGPRVMRP